MPEKSSIRLQIRQEVEALAGREYGWDAGDGEAGLPIREDAKRFVQIRVLGSFGIEVYPEIPNAKSVDLTPAGGIVVKFDKRELWTRDRRRLRLEFPCEGVIVFTRRYRNGATLEGVIRIGEEAMGGPGFYRDVDREIAWLVTGKD